MAVDMFLKLGSIKGESQDEKHKWEIDVLSWSWGYTQTGTTHSAGGGPSGGPAGKASIQDLNFTHWVDLASAELGYGCLSGTHFPEAMLTVRKAGGRGGPIEYVKIKLNNIIITNVTMSGSHGGEQLAESVTLNFQKFEYQYTQQMNDGSSGAKPRFGWDIATNKKL
jgi:type VI secretion system secreted protein Hcp